MITSPKVLFIGLDAADPALLAQGCDAGWLPVLQRLRGNGAWAKVKAPRGFGDGAIWPSLFTGVNPGRHGRYFYQQLKLGTYERVRFAQDTDFGHKPYWEYLSQAGRRIALIDIVKSPHSKEINGIQITDWMVHSQEGPTRSTPPQLASEIMARYGFDPFDGTTDIFKPRTAEDYKAFRDAMIDRVRTKVSLCEHYLKQESWDLFMMSFGDAHDIGHQCWHLHDPSHALHDARWVEQFGDPVKDVYMALDSAIGRLLDCVGPQTTTVVFAGPGMEPDYTAGYLLDKILRRLDGRPEIDRKLIPHGIVSRLRPAAIKTLGQRINHAKFMRDMSRCKYFSVLHNENAGGVRINVAGREPAGCVKPGADYEAVCASLTRDLLDLVNVDTGKPVVKEVVRIADECHGHRLETLPDLFAIWSREAPIRAVTSSKIGVVTEPRVIGARTGDHSPNCVFYVQGPRVTWRGQIDPMAVEDIAPTVTSFLDFVLPDCDGAPVSFDMESDRRATN
jgi:predicted AlkP superfamily phosphohydrolase/phosphomutase